MALTLMAAAAISTAIAPQASAQATRSFAATSPEREGEALVSLYNIGNGPNQINGANTNSGDTWLIGNEPSNR
jgi:hypothetical protein